MRMMALVFLLGCAAGVSGMLRLQDRELLIHPDKPGLAYPHNYTECVNRRKPWRWLGKKCFKKHKIDFYDLNDSSVREKLIDAGFSCTSAMRFKY
jgi:hypothetical protein